MMLSIDLWNVAVLSKFLDLEGLLSKSLLHVLEGLLHCFYLPRLLHLLRHADSDALLDGLALREVAEEVVGVVDHEGLGGVLLDSLGLDVVLAEDFMAFVQVEEQDELEGLVRWMLDYSLACGQHGLLLLEGELVGMALEMVGDGLLRDLRELILRRRRYTAVHLAFLREGHPDGPSPDGVKQFKSDEGVLFWRQIEAVADAGVVHARLAVDHLPHSLFFDQLLRLRVHRI